MLWRGNIGRRQRQIIGYCLKDAQFGATKGAACQMVGNDRLLVFIQATQGICR
jgi:hypothetical protein